MNNIICTECGTENEPQYIYCKNCGCKLERPTQQPHQTGYTQKSSNFTHNDNNSTYNNDTENTKNSNFTHDHQYENYSGSTYNNNENNDNGQSNNYNTYENSAKSFTVDSIQGISTDEICNFIGSKSSQIVPHFTKMEVTNSKISWCWPAAILGFILGPLGAALWFFYRKMYKIALILLAIGCVVTITTSLLTYNTKSTNLDNIFNNIESSQSSGVFSQLIKGKDAKEIAANYIDRIISIATCAITGLFGYYLYKNHIINKILLYRSSCSDNRYYSFGISAIGGTSGGMLALGIVSLVFIQLIANTIISLISIL